MANLSVLAARQMCGLDPPQMAALLDAVIGVARTVPPVPPSVLIADFFQQPMGMDAAPNSHQPRNSVSASAVTEAFDLFDANRRRS